MREQDAFTYRMIQHARERAEEMGVKGQEILDALTHPETDYPSPKEYNRPGEHRRVCTNNRIAVVYEPQQRTVITVLWNRAYNRDEQGQPVSQPDA